MARASLTWQPSEMLSFLLVFFFYFFFRVQSSTFLNVVPDYYFLCMCLCVRAVRPADRKHPRKRHTAARATPRHPTRDTVRPNAPIIIRWSRLDRSQRLSTTQIHLHSALHGELRLHFQTNSRITGTFPSRDLTNITSTLISGLEEPPVFSTFNSINLLSNNPSCVKQMCCIQSIYAVTEYLTLNGKTHKLNEWLQICKKWTRLQIHAFVKLQNHCIFYKIKCTNLLQSLQFLYTFLQQTRISEIRVPNSCFSHYWCFIRCISGGFIQGPHSTCSGWTLVASRTHLLHR